MAEPKILSIQSHVVHGYVGNKAATFPLLLHGFDVDALNTVSLSNHSAYPIIRGHRMDLAEFELIVEGLRANTFLQDYDYVLTGYINNVDIVHQIDKTLEEIHELQTRAGRALARYYCDPVMGDGGHMYCAPTMIEAYRSLLHIVDILTPNYYEAGLLTGIEVVDIDSAVAAADWLHDRGVSHVVIKSFPVVNDATRLQFLLSCTESPSASQDERETAHAAASEGGSGDADTSRRRTRRYTGFVTRYDGYYTGTGDIFCASFVAFCNSHPMPVALGKAMGVLQDLIQATRAEGGVGTSSIKSRELRVTRDPHGLLHPRTAVEVVPL